MQNISTITDLVNISLAKLGVPPISSIDSDTQPATVMNRLFPLVVNTVQSEFPWEELIVDDWEPSTTGTTDDETGYYQFVMPPQLLRIVNLEYNYRYFVRGKKLYVEVNSPKVRYVKYSETVSDWGPQLGRAVIAKLAVEGCMPLTQNAQLQRTLTEEYERFIRAETRRVASRSRRGGPKNTFKLYPWMATRRSMTHA